MNLTIDDFKAAAAVLKCNVSSIKAVYEVETAGHGYLPDGRVKILFEGHRFWKGLSKLGIKEDSITATAMKHPNVLYRSWNKTHYKGGAKEWERVSEAYQVCTELGINTSFALNFASYGSFQIMGENYALCGYASAQEMLSQFNIKGEPEQLNAFISFVKSKGLDDELRQGKWAAFAKGYNGTGYALNQYDIKLDAADKKYSYLNTP